MCPNEPIFNHKIIMDIAVCCNHCNQSSIVSDFQCNYWNSGMQNGIAIHVFKCRTTCLQMYCM